MNIERRLEQSTEMQDVFNEIWSLVKYMDEDEYELRHGRYGKGFELEIDDRRYSVVKGNVSMPRRGEEPSEDDVDYELDQFLYNNVERPTPKVTRVAKTNI